MKDWKARVYEKDEHSRKRCYVAKRLNRFDIDFEKSKWAEEAIMQAAIVAHANLGWKQCPRCGTWNADDWPVEVGDMVEWGGCQACWEQDNDEQWFNACRSVDYADIPF